MKSGFACFIRVYELVPQVIGFRLGPHILLGSIMHGISLAVAFIASAGSLAQGAAGGAQNAGQLASAAAVTVFASSTAAAAIAFHGEGIVIIVRGIMVIAVIRSIGICVRRGS